MQIIWDLLRRTFYLSFFIIPIPLGSYIIHNGSSAMVALISYIVLSLSMPFFYLSSAESGFGPEKKRVIRWLYWVGWLLVQGWTYYGFTIFDLNVIWQLPSFGRDMAFVFVMYSQVSAALMIAYALTRLVTWNKEKVC